MDNWEELNLEDEIRLKRFDPRVLIGYFEKYFKAIDSRYPTSFWEALKYRKRSKAYFKPFENYIKTIEEINSLLNKNNKAFNRFLILVDEGKPTSQCELEIEKIHQTIYSTLPKLEHLNGDKDEFRRLIFIHADLRHRLNLTMMVLGHLIASNLTSMVIDLFAFTSSFFVSMFIEDPVSELLKPAGPLISKLIPAFIVFITIDKLLEWIVQRSLWAQVKRLYIKATIVSKQL
ncbi:MAG TPA: hypothetical protein VGN20_21725 [Mucilaginibacter sp.]|jgi:hypothetical protein